MWGWYPDPQNAQLYPPLMAAWTKMQLGWVRVQPVTGNLAWYLLKSCTSDVIWEITHNMDAGEYFLLEQRYPCDFDVGLRHSNWKKDRSGLAIWHIDEASGATQKTGDLPSVPGSQYPNHYKVALVQGDGKFNLEHRPPADPSEPNLANKGDISDLFMNQYGIRPDKAFKIDNDGTTLCDGVTHHVEPNTKKYSTGTELPTGITIMTPDILYDTWLTVTVLLDGAADQTGDVLPPAA